jgi:hypothetical protein
MLKVKHTKENSTVEQIHKRERESNPIEYRKLENQKDENQEREKGQRKKKSTEW